MPTLSGTFVGDRDIRSRQCSDFMDEGGRATQDAKAESILSIYGHGWPVTEILLLQFLYFPHPVGHAYVAYRYVGTKTVQEHAVGVGEFMDE